MGIEAKEPGAGTAGVMDAGAEAVEPAAREGESAGEHGQISDAAVAGFGCRWHLMPGKERERDQKRGREREKEKERPGLGLHSTRARQEARTNIKKTIGLPADKPDGPGRDAASALASSVWTADWNSVCEKVAVVSVEAGTDVAAGEPMGGVAPEDDMTIDNWVGKRFTSITKTENTKRAACHSTNFAGDSC